MTRLVHGEAERNDVLAAGFNQRHVSVVDRVFLLHALTAIAPVLGASVADQEHDLGLGVLILQLGYGVANRRTHAGGMQRGDLVNPPLHLVAEFLVDVFYYVELHVLPTVAGEAVDPVGITDRL